jgi:competence protein ComEA
VTAPSGPPWRVFDASSPEPGPTPVRPTAVAPPAAPPAVRWGLLIAAAGVGLLAIVVALSGSPGGSVAGPEVPGILGPTSEAEALVVDVAGAVARPGLYRLPVGSRVGDAIAAAGGFAPSVAADAVAVALNLAAPVSDGQQIVVPGHASAVAPGAGGTTPSASGRVDLNRATAAELDALPGIGPATAAKIIASRQERPFASVQDLRTRGLVGEATFTKLRDLVTVG